MRELCLVLLTLALLVLFIMPCSAEDSRIIAIDAGNSYSIALTDNGTIWDWGFNIVGQLGNKSFTDRVYPLPVQVNIDDVKAISTGVYGVAALRKDSTVWLWGFTDSGQMGDGDKPEYDQARSFTSIPIMADITNVKAISTGAGFTIAVKDDGTLWAWGANSDGRLGDGTNTTKWYPVQIYGLSNIKDVKAGNNHWAALDKEGNVWMGGQNITSDIGYKTVPINSTYATVISPPFLIHPVQVTISNVTAITAGSSFSLALKDDGTVWGWGDDIFGELGDGASLPIYGPDSELTRQTPVMVKGLKNVIAIDSFSSRSLALKSDGTVWAWGRDISSTPTKIPIENVVAIACGTDHFLALKNDGSVWAWGGNDDGQLGIGDLSIQASSQPVRVLLGNNPASSIVPTSTPASVNNKTTKPGNNNVSDYTKILAMAGLAIIACGVVYFIIKRR